jgi:hypothetical protein
MEENTINAAQNAAQANMLAAQALGEESKPEAAQITSPTNVEVTLPGGFVTTAGEVLRNVQVRELTGRDEEAISKVSGTPKMYSVILGRGTVSIGDRQADESLLGNLLLGDRDSIMLGIYRATYGDTADMNSWCSECGNAHAVSVDVTKDIKVKSLVDSFNDRVFAVKGKNKEYLVALPTGSTQNKILEMSSSTPAEQLTALLEQVVVQIDGRPVLSRSQIQDLGIVDRQKIAAEIAERSPGPQFEEIKMECPDCGGDLVVPVNLGAMFRL